jgi:hypothetical protein
MSEYSNNIGWAACDKTKSSKRWWLVHGNYEEPTKMGPFKNRQEVVDFKKKQLSI